mgnify:CR=1 FL=1
MSLSKSLAVLIATFILFGFTSAYADFYVVAGGGKKVGTEIKALPYTITESGFYFITKDLTCAVGSHGISIDTDNVTIDLMGFSLIGPGGPAGNYDGIYMNVRTNVEIRNGTIRDFVRNGVGGSGDGTANRIINIRAVDNMNVGILLQGKSNIVEMCTAVENHGIGIYAWSCSLITNNICYNNYYHGIFTSAGSTISHNTCYKNGYLGKTAGHGISAGSRSNVFNNTCYDNLDDGINATSGSAVTGNTCNDNKEDGIDAGIGTTVVGNTCRGNTNSGIKLGGDNLVDQNTATSNFSDISSCTGCVFGVNVPVVP